MTNIFLYLYFLNEMNDQTSCSKVNSVIHLKTHGVLYLLALFFFFAGLLALICLKLIKVTCDGMNKGVTKKN